MSQGLDLLIACLIGYRSGMDPLGDALAVSGVRGALAEGIEAGGRWERVVRARSATVLHAVTAGSAWLTTPEHAAVELVAGDVVLIPAGTTHHLGSEPAGDRTFSAEPLPLSRFGSLPATTRIVTIDYECDPAALTQVLTLLPGLVLVRAESGMVGLSDSVRMLAREVAHPQLATAAVLRSLVDIVLVQMLRAWLTENPPECFGTWLGALYDPVVGKALQCLHADPATPWTTAALAEVISVSRATLSRRFPAATGTTPVAYLATWRMDLAAVRLRDSLESLETIAADVGYGSVPAFSRAFARAHGKTPGRYREEARRLGGTTFRIDQTAPV